MFAVTMHGAEYAGQGSNGAAYALEAFNAALHSHRAYVWLGWELTAAQLLGTRLGFEILLTAAGGAIDWPSKLAGLGTGWVFFEWLRQNAWLGMPWDWSQGLLQSVLARNYRVFS